MFIAVHLTLEQLKGLIKGEHHEQSMKSKFNERDLKVSKEPISGPLAQKVLREGANPNTEGILLT